MAFVGSLSSSIGTTTIAVTGSLVPGSDNFNDLGSSGSKWKTVFSNNITGSLTRLAGGGEYLKPGSNVTLTTGSDGSVTIAAAGGGGTSFFTEDSLNKIFTTGSVAIGFNAPASFKGSDVFFAVSGSNAAANTATFSGAVVASGSLTIKDSISNNTLASISDAGVISGSSNLQVGGNITGSNALLRGDLAVNGGNITTTFGTFTLASSAGTLNLGSSTGVVVVPGDLEVRGTTMTVSASNLVIEDPLIGFGFLTGSTPGSSTGDRGFVGGYTGAGNNVAFGYSFANTAFVATKTNSDATATTFTLGADGLQPIRGSKFQISGSTAEVKGNGSTLQLSGTQLDVFASTNGVTLYKDGTSFLQLLSGSYTSGGGTAGNVAKLEALSGQGILLFPASGKKVHLSGSIELGGGIDNTVSFLGQVGTNIIPSADVSFTLGSPTARWQHIYTGDLHLRNERGDYTLIEESDFLSIRFNKNGKRYKFLLERVPELDER